MIHINKIFFTTVFLVFVCSPIYSQDSQTIVETNKEIEVLVEEISNNLKGTTVFDLFKTNQQEWERYRDSMVKLIFPESINNLPIQWGSIEGYETSKVIVMMNLQRIEVLKNYLSSDRESGTDGKGKFLEYYNELLLYSQIN